MTTLVAGSNMVFPHLAVPRPLVPGDVIRVVAPSGPFDEGLLHQGLARLGEYRCVADEALGRARRGYLAGSDGERLGELQAALDDPEVRAIWVARGGYGLSRIIREVRGTRLERDPIWLVGFSDATILHLWGLDAGVCVLHGPNATTLANAAEEDVVRLRELLAGKQLAPLSGLSPLDEAPTEVIEGPVFGGNLTVLFTEAASGRLRIPEGALLFLEDVTETSYRIDRMLTALEHGGHLAAASAILLGDFTDCSAGKFRVPVEDVLVERLSRLPQPVFTGLPVGHGNRNAPLLLGSRARLDPASGTLAFEPPLQGK